LRVFWESKGICLGNFTFEFYITQKNPMLGSFSRPLYRTSSYRTSPQPFLKTIYIMFKGNLSQDLFIGLLSTIPQNNLYNV